MLHIVCGFERGPGCITTLTGQHSLPLQLRIEGHSCSLVRTEALQFISSGRGSQWQCECEEEGSEG